MADIANTANSESEEKGLTASESALKIKEVGFNEIPEKKNEFFKKIIKWFTSPISLMLIAASVLSFVSSRDFDGYFILFLLLLNFGVSFWQEKKADNAIQKLKEKLIIEIKVLRDRNWSYIKSKYLVPGDIVELDIGNIIPADAEVVNTKNLSVNEAVITGESLPKDKKQGDVLYSGSYIASGMCTAKITATGKNTSFGKTLISIETNKKKSILEKDIMSVAKYISATSIIVAVILTVYFLIVHQSVSELLLLDLSLLIAGVPVALPTVMTLIISVGVLILSKKNVIVRRLSSLEDLSNVNLLLTDKTGTLTKNQINVEKVIPYNSFKEKDVTKYGFYAIQGNEKNPIDSAILRDAKLKGFEKKPAFVDFVPFDSIRKRSTATIQENGKKITVSVGAPQMIEKYCSLGKGEKKTFENDFLTSGQNGYKSLAVAVAKGDKEKSMELVGLILLSDTLYPDIKDSIKFMREEGIDVRMLTGDSDAIARRIANDIGLEGEIAKRGSFGKNWITEIKNSNYVGFSEIFPSDKMDLVQLAQKQRKVVAVTGDGINDLPAIHSADVGIAVSNGVDAVKSSADIVLISNGLGVIKTAIIEARKIFSRLYTYSVYRISESFRLIFSIGILGIIYGLFPLAPIQIILLAILNDLPIISLAYDRVNLANKPASIDVKKRLVLATSFGLVGVFNSILLFVLANNVFHLPIGTIQTLFFLKLAIGGHALVFVSHTKEKWYKFLPSKQVIIATVSTQIIATILAVTGVLMNQISILYALIIWLWVFFWMQISDLTKVFVRERRRRASNPDQPKKSDIKNK